MHVLYRLQEGGTEYGVIKVVNGLDRRFVISSICSTTPATSVKNLLLPDVRLHECQRRAGNDPRLVWEMFQIFRRERPDIVHTHAWGTLCEGLVAARLARVPHVVHGEHGTLQLKPHQARVQRWAWSRADHLLSVSSRLADRMARDVGISRERVTVIQNGVDLQRFSVLSKAETRRVLGLSPDAFIVGTVGRLVEVKNQALLLNAVAPLVAAGLQCQIVIAGEGPLRPTLEQLTQSLGLLRAVRLLGHRPDVERVLAALDVFALPSRSEGMSNTILEAMAARLPVVATDVGGTREMIVDGETGVLVPSGDAAALAAALERLASDGALRERMGDAGRLRVEQQFSLEAMLRQYKQVYLQAGIAREVS